MNVSLQGVSHPWGHREGLLVYTEILEVSRYNFVNSIVSERRTLSSTLPAVTVSKVFQWSRSTFTLARHN